MPILSGWVEEMKCPGGKAPTTILHLQKYFWKGKSKAQGEQEMVGEGPGSCEHTICISLTQIAPLPWQPAEQVYNTATTGLFSCCLITAKETITVRSTSFSEDTSETL